MTIAVILGVLLGASLFLNSVLVKRALQYSDALDETQKRVVETFEYLDGLTRDKKISSSADEVVAAHNALRNLVSQLENAIIDSKKREKPSKKDDRRPVVV